MTKLKKLRQGKFLIKYWKGRGVIYSEMLLTSLIFAQGSRIELDHKRCEKKKSSKSLFKL